MGSITKITIEDLIPKSSKYLFFYINSDKKRLKNINPKTTLLEYLRNNKYTGTKYVCGEGGCGACTVVIAEFDASTNMIKYRSANSCLVPLCSIHNKQIITVEGIGSPEKPHSIQERLALGHGSQCGFCTPGIIMSFYSLLKINPCPNEIDIEEALDGNLCRCTGYAPIMNSMKTFSEKSCNGNSCKTSGSCSQLSDLTHLKPYDPNSDLPFPEDLVKVAKENCVPLLNEAEDSFWVQVNKLDDLLEIKKYFPQAKIVGGNTEIGIEMKIRSMDYKYFINASNVPELRQVEIKDENGKRSLEIGLNITLEELADTLKEFKEKKVCYKHEFSLLDAFLSNLRWFASRQIRNFATLAGNIVTASPISDLNPIYLAADATITLISAQSGEREISMRNFFLNYRKTDMQPSEIALKLKIRLPQNSMEIIRSYKQAKRKDDDTAIVNAAFRIKLQKELSFLKISSLDISFGGLAPTTIYLAKTNEETKGLEFGCEKSLRIIEDLILSEVNFPFSVPGAMASYRRTLAVSFFTRFWYQIVKEVEKNRISKDIYNIDEIEKRISVSKVDVGAPKSTGKIGSATPHLSALNQATGVAQFLDDIPKQQDELFAYLVVSTKAHALIKRIDSSKALEIDGVHAFICHKDVPHENAFGVVQKDEEFFAETEVVYYGQIIGAVIAESREIAKKAASYVQIDYETLDAILTIEEAIERNSFLEPFELSVKKGDFSDRVFEIEGNCSDKVFEGECRIGGQEHFYLETQCALAIPKSENNEMEIYSSTQNLAEVQAEVANLLGVDRNRIVCKVKRLGGGFGGKETRATPIAAVAALAAHKLKRPVRCVLERDMDMLVTGKRHPFWAKYKIRVSDDGYFKALDLYMIANAGCSFDLSVGVIERAIAHCDNVYNVPVMRVFGKLAKTNIASNTAYRGFGGPQSMMIMEQIVSVVAEQLSMDPIEIREKNFYKENEITHVKMPIKDWYLPEMWHEIIQETKFRETRAEIEKFNSENRWKKRGLSIVPTKFGVAFGATFLNQGSALVNIYLDGSVLLSHGGIEMGQGLHTKMAQIAADTLDIPLDKVYINETSTDKNPNASPTAASVSSDINGMAVLNACQQLTERLQPYKDKNPQGKFADWVRTAYYDRISLSATGFYKTPNLTYDWKTNTGQMYSYFTTGVAVAQVELDLLTGDHVILSTDIIMDIGNSINLAIDVGQIQGAFIQGLGWCTLEETLVLSANGAAFTRGPGNYKIPSFRSVPERFNVKVIRDKDWKGLKTIKSSKGIGEPPLFLAASVFFALRDAVCYARKANGVTKPLLRFDSPCTPEILRLACEDRLVEKARVVARRIDGMITSEKAWAVRT